jgi:signal transduction histidine kinase
MIAAFLSRLRQRKLEVEPGMSTRLVLGFCGSILIAMLVLSLIVITVMRERIYRTADEEMASHARTLQTIILNQQGFLAEEAASSADLDGVQQALANRDLPELRRLLSPSLLSHDLTSVYVIDSNRQVLLQLGERMAADATIVHLPMVETSLTQSPESSFVDIDSALWLGASARRLLPDGKTAAVILLGKHLDQRYVRSLSDLMGTQVVLAWGNAAAYSFPTPPPGLSLSHLRASLGPVAEYHDTGAYHSMAIGGESYRVAAFTFATPPSGQLLAILLEPSGVLDASVREALLGVVGLSLLILLFGGPLLFLYARRVMRPLDRLTIVAKQIAQGDLDQRVESTSQNEVGQLALAFEEMRVQVQSMLRAQKQWNAELEARVRAKTSQLEELSLVRDQLLGETITAQEEERRRVARELHDETCQSLAALIANLAAASRLPEAELRLRLDALRGTVADALKEVNRIVLDLRPTLLDDFGLGPALSWFAEQRLGEQTLVEVSTPYPEIRLPPAIETTLFRIGQEAITNAAKYAQARHLYINLLLSQEHPGATISLEIQDDGRGFDLEDSEVYSAGGRRHLGLHGMRERIALLGGSLEIESTPGRGTSLCAYVPLGTGSFSAESKE